MKLSAPIFQLKRRAKAISREESIPLTEALNRVAQSEGFGAWSLLAALYAKRNPTPAILANLEPGDMVLLGARPMQGKTVLALRLLAEARKAGRSVAYFSLECTSAEAADLLKACGLQASEVLLDTSDSISADYMIARLTEAEAKAGAVIVVDYLQALDHRRENPPLADQIERLKAFGAHTGVIFVFISQIDRHYDALAKPLPDMEDVRMPNRVDTSLFNKACFLREGELVFRAA